MPGIRLVLMHVFLTAISQNIFQVISQDISSEVLTNYMLSSESEDLSDEAAEPSDQECFCTYDYLNSFVRARVGHRLLKRGDQIKRGETVSLECRYVSTVLTWPNGLRFFGRANMTCSTCEKWRMGDLPICTSAVETDVVLGHEEDLTVLPGGTVQVQKGENRHFFCSNFWRQPEWTYGRMEGVSVTTANYSGVRETIYVSYLVIKHAEDKHTGIYECFSRSPSGRQTLSTFLHIEVIGKPDSPSCSKFPDSPGLRVLYNSIDLSVGTFAILSCPASNRVPNTAKSSICLEDGTWSRPPPKCENDSGCLRFPDSPGLQVRYTSDDILNRTVARLSCRGRTKNSRPIFSICQEDGTWSIPPPNCELFSSCLRFPDSPELLVRYTSDDMSVGTLASLSCRDSTRNSTPILSICQGDGTWSNPPPKCEPERNRIFIVEHPGYRPSSNETTTSKPQERTDDKNNRECVCIYNSEDIYMVAEVGGRILKAGDTIMLGETVSFRCKRRRLMLSWDNNLRYQGKAHMTCSRCEVWSRTDIPSCHLHSIKDSVFIDSEEDLKFLPGGILHMRKGESHNISCVSTKSPSKWKYETKENVSELIRYRGIYYTSLLVIKQANYGHRGIYECISENAESIHLQLEVDDSPSCSKFPDSPGLRVLYNSIDLSVGTVAVLTCPASSRKSSNISSVCQEDGTWSNPAPVCEDPKCSRDDLIIILPEDIIPDIPIVNDELTPGSEVLLKCKNSITTGKSKALCGEHGRWKVDIVRCVPGCLLDVDPSSNLVVNPMKDSYRIGEFILLSCPLYYQLSSEVDRLMCLSGTWSDDLPKCVKEI